MPGGLRPVPGAEQTTAHPCEAAIAYGRRQGRECASALTERPEDRRSCALEALQKHRHAMCEVAPEQARSACTRNEERGASAVILRQLAAGVRPRRRNAPDRTCRRAASPHAARCTRAVVLADLTNQYNVLHLHHIVAITCRSWFAITTPHGAWT